MLNIDSALKLKVPDDLVAEASYHNLAGSYVPNIYCKTGFPYVLALTLITISGRAVAQQSGPPDAIDWHDTVSLDRLIPQLETKRVIFVGEMHDRYDNHLNQLAIIQRLHQLDSNLAIGVEYFEQPFQVQVDDYIAGKTTEREFLQATDYFETWGFDYRLYAPIFRYAREHKVPVRALNVPATLASAVAKRGIAGLAPDQRTYLPKEIVPADEAYRSRLREAFEEHKSSQRDAFEHFVEAQLVWDEGMAESAAAYLNAHPENKMVILAGAGHVEFGTGIPKRLERRTKATSAIVVSSGIEVEPQIADYVLLSNKQELPAAGVLGVNVEEKDGQCRIRSVVPGGAAEKAGLKKGDVLVEVDHLTIKKRSDVRVALWDKKSGDRVQVTVRRKSSTKSFDVELAASPMEPH